jgi:hypothetical protein
LSTSAGLVPRPARKTAAGNTRRHTLNDSRCEIVVHCVVCKPEACIIAARCYAVTSRPVELQLAVIAELPANSTPQHCCRLRVACVLIAGCVFNGWLLAPYTNESHIPTSNLQT